MSFSLLVEPSLARVQTTCIVWMLPTPPHLLFFHKNKQIKFTHYKNQHVTNPPIIPNLLCIFIPSFLKHFSFISVSIIFFPPSPKFSLPSPPFNGLHEFHNGFSFCLKRHTLPHHTISSSNSPPSLSNPSSTLPSSKPASKPPLSTNGDFAFGFFNVTDEPNQFSVGIRFNSNSIPYSQQTLVWVPGGHVKVSNMSYFQLTSEGELVLVDSLHGVTTWTSGTGNRSVVSVALHDNGNLVLVDAKQTIIWQSFDNPSDTLLPGQRLHVSKTLRASSKNLETSYYSLYLNASGRLQLRWESNIVYWTSESYSSTENLTATITSDGSLQLQDQHSRAIWSVFGEDHNDSANYRFLRLDFDGNLRLYSWMEDSQSWRSVWQDAENQCKVFATCGERGVCVFNASGSAPPVSRPPPVVNRI